MDQHTHFGEVLEAVSTLSPDEQLTLVNIVARRLAADGRKRVAASVEESRREFDEGRCQPTTVDDLISEIMS
jgi:hypothetical protein